MFEIPDHMLVMVLVSAVIMLRGMSIVRFVTGSMVVLLLGMLVVTVFIQGEPPYNNFFLSLL